MDRFRMMSIKKLIHSHIFENGRINQVEKEITQQLIENELRQRTERLIRALRDTESMNYDLKNRTIDEEAESFMRWIVNAGG